MRNCMLHSFRRMIKQQTCTCSTNMSFSVLCLAYLPFWALGPLTQLLLLQSAFSVRGYLGLSVHFFEGRCFLIALLAGW
jgi:hypothetical protein